MPTPPGVDLGLFYRIPGLSAAALDAELLPSSDVSNYAWISFYIGISAYVGELTFWSSYDEVTWEPQIMFVMTTYSTGDIGAITVANNVQLGTPRHAPFFKVTMTDYTSGTATGIAEFHKQGPAGVQFRDTGAFLYEGNEFIGLINNDGTNTDTVAAGTTGNTVIVSGEGTLAQILVTQSGTNAMTIYDQDTTPTGKIIAIIPANSPVDGIPFTPRMPYFDGIIIDGDAGNPGITIAWTVK